MRMVKTSVFDEVQAEYYIFCLLLFARVCVCVCLLLSNRDFLSITRQYGSQVPTKSQPTATAVGRRHFTLIFFKDQTKIVISPKKIAYKNKVKTFKLRSTDRGK